MLSNQKIKWIQSLSRKKFRELHNVYLIEGTKIVQTALSVCPEKIEEIFILPEDAKDFSKFNEKITIAESTRIKKISHHTTASPVIALVKIPSNDEIKFSKSSIKLYLDGVQDPGNVGTIIRSCDWFGIKDLILNNKCADEYSPKVIQAAMGSHFSMNIHRLDFNELFNKFPDHLYVGADMEGSERLPNPLTNLILCMGNEGKGLSNEVRKACSFFYSIPGSKSRLAESLNVSVATGILLNRLTS